MSFPLRVNHVNSRVVYFVNWLQVIFLERQNIFSCFEPQELSLQSFTYCVSIACGFGGQKWLRFRNSLCSFIIPTIFYGISLGEIQFKFWFCRRKGNYIKVQAWAWLIFKRVFKNYFTKTTLFHVIYRTIDTSFFDLLTRIDFAVNACDYHVIEKHNW